MQTRVQVFASDVAEESLQRARLGIYSPEIEDSISGERLAKFFVRDEHGYRVRPELRNIVVFAFHDVVNDFPFSQLDLVVCRRDVLEDLKPEVRKTVLRNLHYSLRPHGLLVVDSSAGLDVEAPKLFAVDGDGGVYRRLAARPSVVPPPGIGAASRRATGARACAAGPRSMRGSCTSACSSGMHPRACSSTPTVTSFTTRRGPAVTFAYPAAS